LTRGQVGSRLISVDRRSGRRGFVRALACIVGALAALAMFASSAAAKTFTVTRGDDPAPSGCGSGDCSLREAVLAANGHQGADSIGFARSLSGSTIQLALGELSIRSKLTIAGPGATKLSISGNHLSRVFRMTGGRITIQGLTIRDGHETATPTGPQCPGSTAPNFTLGGGILQDAGSLSVEHVKMSNNTVEGPTGIIGGGGIAIIDGQLSVAHSRLAQSSSLGANISSGGGIFSCGGPVTIKASSIHDSTVTSHAIAEGGGVAVQGQSGEDAPVLTMKKSTVSNNEVSSEAISDAGGVSVVNRPAVIDQSTISENRGIVTGGGSIVDGAGLFVANTKVSVTNSTITGNIGTAPLVTGGGILVAGTGEKLDLLSSTVARNIADASNSGRGGNLAGADSAKLRNTIVAKGKATTGPNCDAAVKSSNHSLEDQDTCGFAGKGDRVNTNPKVRNLAQNGGPTDTIALKKDSPAIDHASKKSSPRRDQRGFKRDGKPDIGAYEFGAKP
jgi:CSLREA domain-containing protein